MTNSPDQSSAGSEGAATREYVLRAMAKNYKPGNSWDRLDAEACIQAADEIKQLRTDLADSRCLVATYANEANEARAAGTGDDAQSKEDPSSAGRYCEPGHVLMPQSVEEAKGMCLVAEAYLKANGGLKPSSEGNV